MKRREIYEGMGVVGDLRFNVNNFIKLKRLRKIPGGLSGREAQEIVKDNYRREGINRKRTKDNTGNFFVQLYQSLFGGEIQEKPVHHECEGERFENENFQPDLIRYDENYGRILTEIKSSSIKNGFFECGNNQAGQYCNRILRNLIEFGKDSFAEYAFISYGRGGTNPISNLQKLSLPKFVNILSNNTRRLVVVPINLALFMFIDGSTRKEKRNKLESRCSEISKSFMVKGGFTSRLQKGKQELEKIMINYQSGVIMNPKIVEDLFLDKLQFRQIESPLITAVYRKKEIPVKPFLISKYFLERKDYLEFSNHFMKNHKSILEKLGLRNIFQQNLEETIRISANDEGISFKEAMDNYKRVLERKIKNRKSGEIKEPRIEDVPF